MEVITRDTEEVRAYFKALEEGMRYLDTVTAHFRPAMNGEVYLTGEDVCRLLHITPRTLQDYRCLLYTSPSPRDGATSRMPSSA